MEAMALYLLLTLRTKWKKCEVIFLVVLYFHLVYMNHAF